MNFWHYRLIRHFQVSLFWQISFLEVHYLYQVHSHYFQNGLNDININYSLIFYENIMICTGQSKRLSTLQIFFIIKMELGIRLLKQWRFDYCIMYMYWSLINFIKSVNECGCRDKINFMLNPFIPAIIVNIHIIIVIII